MGVQGLWTLLNASEGLVTKLEGAKGHHPDILQSVEGRTVAIDLSVWMFQVKVRSLLKAQATMQRATQGLFSSEGAFLKVVFERTIHYLRYGIVPVGVTEGMPPAEKLDKLVERSRLLYGHERSSNLQTVAPFGHASLLARQLLEAMGLPVMKAPGEAEAAAAALNACGLVDAVQSPDGDALLFGARMLFHTLKLATHDPREAVLKRCDTDSLCKELGVSGAAIIPALTAVALLCGGDYDGGAGGVGPRQAITAIRALLATASPGGNCDVNVLDLLAASVENCPVDSELLIFTQCSRCKRCEGSICQDNTPLGPCSCRFCSSHSSRVLLRVLERVRAEPGFLERAKAASEAYRDQAQLAATAATALASSYGLAPGERLGWLSRPDCEAVAQVLQSADLPWSDDTVRTKLLPLLLEWDAQHPICPDRQFQPLQVTRVQRSRQDHSWRFLLAWERLGGGSPQEREADEARLKSSVGDCRAVRCSVVECCHPALLSAWHTSEREKEQKQQQAAERRAKKAAGGATKPPARTVTDYFFLAPKVVRSASPQAGGSQAASEQGEAVSEKEVPDAKHVRKQPTTCDGLLQAGSEGDGQPNLGSPAKKQRTPTKPARAVALPQAGNILSFLRKVQPPDPSAAAEDGPPVAGKSLARTRTEALQPAVTDGGLCLGATAGTVVAERHSTGVRKQLFQEPVASHPGLRCNRPLRLPGPDSRSSGPGSPLPSKQSSTSGTQVQRKGSALSCGGQAAGHQAAEASGAVVPSPPEIESLHPSPSQSVASSGSSPSHPIDLDTPVQGHPGATGLVLSSGPQADQLIVLSTPPALVNPATSVVDLTSTD